MGSTKKTDHNPVVKIIKDFNVPAEKVFDAWLDPEMLSRWMFGPDLREEEIVKLETNPEEGETFSYIVRRGDEVLNHLGTYLELDRPRRLVFTWGIKSESEGESVVSIDIVPAEDGCRLTLVHELDPKWEAYADRTKAGWSYMLDKLNVVFTEEQE